MSSSIGNDLNALVNSTVQRALHGTAGLATGTSGTGAATGGSSFAAKLMQQFDKDHDSKLDVTELGKALADPASGGAAANMLQNSDPGNVDALWQRAKLLSQAGGNGMADAMMKQMDAADAAKADRRDNGSHGGAGDLSGMFDF